MLSSDIDLLHPPVDLEKQKNKRKRLVQSPNSFFMDVKCQGCFQMCAALPPDHCRAPCPCLVTGSPAWLTNAKLASFRAA